MNNQIKGMMYYYTQGVIYSAKIFLLILAGLLAVSCIICYLLLGTDEFKMYFAIPFATYFNVGIIGYQLVKGNVPFGLKMGAVRKNIYIMQVYFMLLYSMVMAVIGNVLQLVTELLQKWIGIDNFQFTHLAMLLSDNPATRIVVDTLVMFFIMNLLYLFGLIFYRTGLLGGTILLAVLLLVVLFGVFEGWLIRGVIDVMSNISWMFFITLFVLGIAFWLIGYPLMRKITVVKTR
ncbi:hypothetical protein [Gracilibacillus alcaliphilus]|uniref:hypothetical protein n=1 Tax=Gracilibacillus alcaliphilus TaxID=1401441 RepID=UPI00195BCAAA|nr:hypothetical protein [Gracilibacillus alcaliphilus]MBM7676514.1 hypothetical protein [Gracilibacillus alcaliphilus]